jgi:hypothetical protein
MRKIFFLILIPTMSAAQSSRGGIGYDSGGGDTTIGAFLAIGTAIVIMLLGIGGAIGEAGKDKLQDLKEKKIKRKIKRNQSEVMQELRKKPDNMLIGIGRALVEVGNDKRIDKKRKRSKSEVTQELRKKPADPNKTEEQNRKEAVISIQRKRLRAFNNNDPWWKW